MPPWLEGAWRRVGRARNDGEVVEPADVLWLQASSAFADVRVPRDLSAAQFDSLDEPQAFSGRARYSRTRMTWYHDLDTDDYPAEDTGILSRAGDDIVERGEDYLEWWHRVDRGGPVVVVEALGSGGRLVARVVRVGDLANAVWRDSAAGGASFLRIGEQWAMSAAVGDGAFDLNELILAFGGCGAVGAHGWTWTDASTP